MSSRSAFALNARSPLRRVDARVKLALGLAASAAVMLPLAPLLVAVAAFALLIAVAGLRDAALAPLRRLAPLLALLFALDWALIGGGLAMLVTARLVLLVTAFTVLVATTTPDELRVALERLGLPARLAFVLASAYRSLAHLEREWRAILEAQQARGITPLARGADAPWRQRLGDAVALIVPAIVLATQRAWALTEAASMRGLESPARARPERAPLAALDRLLLSAAALLLLALAWWR
ncbi:MAG TPA: energy-coupling factor transporter transmembrane component T [Candidatus Dormibacteraeota bacterium]|nr:energy-coupling factor transporter transmembrane component T [Candidatus Dormibacteraeota bacterium]